MRGAGLQAKDVAGEMEGVDLAAAVAQQLARPDRAGHDLVEIVGIVAFGEELVAAGEDACRAGEALGNGLPRQGGGSSHCDCGGDGLPGSVGGAVRLHLCLPG